MQMSSPMEGTWSPDQTVEIPDQSVEIPYDPLQHPEQPQQANGASSFSTLGWLSMLAMATGGAFMAGRSWNGSAIKSGLSDNMSRRQQTVRMSAPATALAADQVMQYVDTRTVWRLRAEQQYEQEYNERLKLESKQRNADLQTLLTFDNSQMKQLGEGQNGDCWQATDLETGEVVVVKFVKDEVTDTHVTWNTADPNQTINMLKSIEECKVVNELIEIGNRIYPPGASRICECKGEHVSQRFTGPNETVYTVWEMAGYEDLTTMEKPTNLRMRIQVARAITKQIAEALALFSMVNPPIIHHDLKSQNVVVSGSLYEGFDVKIIDFGCFIPATRDMQNSLSFGDHIYMPPEHTVSCAFAYPASSFDMYALGVIHMELICPELKHKNWAYASDGSKPTVEMIMQAMERKCPELFTADVADLVAPDLTLIQSCLRTAPHERPTPMDVVEKLSNSLSFRPREQVAFREGDMVEMLINSKWVRCFVENVTDQTYDIDVCEDADRPCTTIEDVDPAYVKAVVEVCDDDIEVACDILQDTDVDVAGVRPGSELFDYQMYVQSSQPPMQHPNEVNPNWIG
jgi:serine/threonine protein kinase